MAQRVRITGQMDGWFTTAWTGVVSTWHTLQGVGGDLISGGRGEMKKVTLEGQTQETECVDDNGNRHITEKKKGK